MHPTNYIFFDCLTIQLSFFGLLSMTYSFWIPKTDVAFDEKACRLSFQFFCYFPADAHHLRQIP